MHVGNFYTIIQLVRSTITECYAGINKDDGIWRKPTKYLHHKTEIKDEMIDETRYSNGTYICICTYTYIHIYMYMYTYI